MQDILQHKSQSPGHDTVILTPAAINEVKRLISEQPNAAQLVLRVGVEGGGCSGLSYSMVFDKEIRKDDRVFEYNDLKVVTDSTSLKYITGTTIDFNGELLTGGFKFSNPNAARGCGCGTSFSV